jgi:endonuclease YncB( thermonuclease family)
VDYYRYSKLDAFAANPLTLLLLVGFVETSAQKAPPAKQFERFDGCVLTPDEWTDGDSFRVRLPDGRLKTFRLYFVDTTESRSRGEALGRPGGLLRPNETGAIKFGEEAKGVTGAALRRPFTIQTPAQSLWTNSLLRMCVDRRRRHSRRTARRKRSGPYLWNARHF